MNAELKEFLPKEIELISHEAINYSHFNRGGLHLDQRGDGALACNFISTRVWMRPQVIAITITVNIKIELVNAELKEFLPKEIELISHEAINYSRFNRGGLHLDQRGDGALACSFYKHKSLDEAPSHSNNNNS